LAIGLSWVTIFLNFDAGSWEDAASLHWWPVLVVAAGALAGGFTGYRLATPWFQFRLHLKPRRL
jgi:hypothetical protein